MGDVASAAAEHVPVPRKEETVYRLGVRVGKVPYQPRPGDFPLTCICACGRTIRQASADVPWAHQSW